MIEIMGKEYLTDKEAAKRYGYSVSWFQKARLTKKSPPYMKLNGKGKVFYALKELDDWFKNHFLKYA